MAPQFVLPDEEDEGELFEAINEEDKIEPFMAMVEAVASGPQCDIIGKRIMDIAFDWHSKSRRQIDFDLIKLIFNLVNFSATLEGNWKSWRSEQPMG